MVKDTFEKAFANNFYLSDEWAKFCSEVTSKKLSEIIIDGKKIFLLEGKNIGIHPYDDLTAKEMKQKKISFMRVLPQQNNKSEKKSFFEYALLIKRTYAEAVQNYSRSFKDDINQGKKFTHELKIYDEYDEKITKQVYEFYKKHMKRLNSFVFPYRFFRCLMECHSSKLFLIMYNNDLIAYAFCFQYEDNLYASIGGSNPEFFKYKAPNKIYDELIKYACANQLNLHLGIGMSGAGFNFFKERVGAINYKCERYPDDELMLRIFAPLLRSKIVGKLLSRYSSKHPEKSVYMSMPFT